MVINGFYAIMQTVYDLFQLEFVIDGYSFSMWSAFLFVCVCIIASRFFGGITR